MIDVLRAIATYPSAAMALGAFVAVYTVVVGVVLSTVIEAWRAEYEDEK